MELDQAIQRRRSIRKYLDRDVPDSLIRDLVHSALHAPSSMNGQPWYFVVVRNRATKDSLVEIKNRHCPIEKQMFDADFLRSAPVILVVCVDKERSHHREVENGVLATSHILLAARKRSLGSVYLSAYRAGDPELAGEIRELLNIPSHVDPITIVPLGYPNETPESKTIRSPDEVIFYEDFGTK